MKKKRIRKIKKRPSPQVKDWISNTLARNLSVIGAKGKLWVEYLDGYGGVSEGLVTSARISYDKSAKKVNCVLDIKSLRGDVVQVHHERVLLSGPLCELN